MFKKIFFIAIFLSVPIATFSQNENKPIPLDPLPKSIYIEDWSKTFSFQSTSLKETLHLKDFKFLVFDEEDIRNNFFSFDFRNFGRKASSYSYESYKNIDLYKHFPKVYDLRTIPWKNNY